MRFFPSSVSHDPGLETCSDGKSMIVFYLYSSVWIRGRRDRVKEHSPIKRGWFHQDQVDAVFGS